MKTKNLITLLAVVISFSFLEQIHAQTVAITNYNSDSVFTEINPNYYYEYGGERFSVIQSDTSKFSIRIINMNVAPPDTFVWCKCYGSDFYPYRLTSLCGTEKCIRREIGMRQINETCRYCNNTEGMQVFTLPMHYCADSEKRTWTEE